MVRELEALYHFPALSFFCLNQGSLSQLCPMAVVSLKLGQIFSLFLVFVALIIG